MNDPKKLASKGRYGDTMLAHINPEEAALLKSRGGAGTINPKTGLPEFHGYYQYKELEATRKAEAEAATAAAKAKASAEKSAAVSRALTAEQRQANIARDLALSQTRGARPSGQDSQFYQPVYQSPYQNYNSSAQPVMNQQTGQPSSGNVLTPELARSLMQMAETTGLPKSESDKYGGYAAIKALYNAGGGNYAPPGQQFNAPSLPFNPYTNSFGATGGAFPAQTPFSYQQPAAQSSTPFSYQQPASQANYGFNYSAPMQLPQYVYDTNRDVGLYQSQPVQAYKSTRPVSSGPSQAIVGRSSQMRGTPNVMRRAKGGIASLLKKHK